MKSECCISILSINIRCGASYFCWCTSLLKSVQSFLLDVSSSLVKSRGSPDGSGGKSILVASICKCVDVLLVRIILQT